MFKEWLHSRSRLSPGSTKEEPQNLKALLPILDSETQGNHESACCLKAKSSSGMNGNNELFRGGRAETFEALYYVCVY